MDKRHSARISQPLRNFHWRKEMKTHAADVSLGNCSHSCEARSLHDVTATGNLSVNLLDWSETVYLRLPIKQLDLTDILGDGFPLIDVKKSCLACLRVGWLLLIFIVRKYSCWATLDRFNPLWTKFLFSSYFGT